MDEMLDDATQTSQSVRAASTTWRRPSRAGGLAAALTE
jgi:hypothetical protein